MPAPSGRTRVRPAPVAPGSTGPVAAKDALAVHCHGLHPTARTVKRVTASRSRPTAPAQGSLAGQAAPGHPSGSVDVVVEAGDEVVLVAVWVVVDETGNVVAGGGCVVDVVVGRGRVVEVVVAGRGGVVVVDVVERAVGRASVVDVVVARGRDEDVEVDDVLVVVRIVVGTLRGRDVLVVLLLELVVVDVVLAGGRAGRTISLERVLSRPSLATAVTQKAHSVVRSAIGTSPDNDPSVAATGRPRSMPTLHGPPARRV